MIKRIYICDKCGNETENEEHIKWCKLVDFAGDGSYLKMICLDCFEEIKSLIDNNYMVLDPEELRK